MPLSRDHIVWAYRLLLDRDPESEAAITPKMHGYGSTADLRRDIMTSPEFAEKNADLAEGQRPTIVIKPLPSGLRIFVDLADRAIGLNIARDSFEQAELACAVRHVQPGQVAIDAGAHVGLFALHLAERVGPSGHIYAFEPFPANAALLEQSVAENDFGGRLTVTRVAVGAAPGSAEIVYATHTLNTGGAFLVGSGEAGLPGHARLGVDVVSLDTTRMRRPVALIKLDIEGAELQALSGSANLLAEDHPMLLAEVHHEQLRRVSNATAADFFAWLARLGYRAFGICHDGTLGEPMTDPPTAPVSTVAFVAAGPPSRP